MLAAFYSHPLVFTETTDSCQFGLNKQTWFRPSSMHANAHSLIWRMCFRFFIFFCLFWHMVCGVGGVHLIDWGCSWEGAEASDLLSTCAWLGTEKPPKAFHLSWSWRDGSATHPPLCRRDGIFSDNLDPLVDFWCCWNNNEKVSRHPLRDLSDTVMLPVLRCPQHRIFF